MKGYLTLRISFREKDHYKEITVKYLVIDTHPSYNMIIWWLAFNWLWANLSTLYLCMKYQLPNIWVGVFWGYQEMIRRERQVKEDAFSGCKGKNGQLWNHAALRDERDPGDFPSSHTRRRGLKLMGNTFFSYRAVYSVYVIHLCNCLSSVICLPSWHF